MADTIRILISQPDGSFSVTTINPDLDVMQKIVGGYIEVVSDPSGFNGFSAYCNEEGKLQGLPVNATSTRFMDRLFTERRLQRFSVHDVLVGPVFWCGGADEEGDDTSLPAELINQFATSALADAVTESGRDDLISVARHGLDVWVTTGDPEGFLGTVKDLIQHADTSAIEVWPSVTPELRDALTSRFEHEDANTVFH